VYDCVAYGNNRHNPFCHKPTATHVYADTGTRGNIDIIVMPPMPAMTAYINNNCILYRRVFLTRFKIIISCNILRVIYIFRTSPYARSRSHIMISYFTLTHFSRGGAVMVKLISTVVYLVVVEVLLCVRSDSFIVEHAARHFEIY